MRLKVALLGFLVLPLLGLSHQASAMEEPHTVVINTVGDVLDRLKSERELIKSQPEKVYDVINDLILPNFDFDFISKAVLGKETWQNSNDEQHSNFTTEFTTLMVRTYAKALLGFTDETIKYIETVSNPNSNIVMVKTEIQSGDGNSKTPVNYWLHISDGNWKVINVAFQGVNLVKTYRKEYAPVVSNSGLDVLIQKLSEKNQTLAKTVLE